MTTGVPAGGTPEHRHPDRSPDRGEAMRLTARDLQARLCDLGSPEAALAAHYFKTGPGQ